VAVPLLRTKLYISALQSEIVARSQLVQQLNAGLLRTATLISAPAGFGKTTLLREWITDQDLEVAWFSIDQGDNDPIRFWAYVVAALQCIEPDLGEHIFAALQTPQPPSIDSLLADLINEISSNSGIHPDAPPGRKLVLVLDDYHLINNPAVQDSLFFFLENLPPRVHLVISSRADPPWPLARLRARQNLLELRADDLRFTSQEVAIFLNQVMNLNITTQDIAALEKRTEGWIVGLQMAALSMQNRSDIPSFIQAFTGTHRFILDYLLEEVLEQQPLVIQAFLLKTALLDQLTAPLCDFVLGHDDSQHILLQLEKTNLFLVPLDDQRQWFRYHHLFSELLQNQLQLSYPQEVPRLHQKASQWFEAQGYVDQTVAHAFAAQDNQRVAQLCEKFGESMLQQNRHSLLSAWIEVLPQELVYQRPWLCVYQSWTRHWAGIRERGEECLENAERMLISDDSLSQAERDKLAGSIATVHAHYALVNERLPQAIEQASKALRLLPKSDYYTAGTAGVALGGAYWGQGDITRAEEAFMECAATALKGGFAFRASSALCYAGMQQVKQAQLKVAEQTFHKAVSLAKLPGGRLSPDCGFPLAKLSELTLEWNDLDQARTLAADGLKLCRQLGHVDLIAEACIAVARVQIASQDFSGVRTTLQELESLSLLTKLDPWVLGWFDECRVRLWLAVGEIEQAVYWAASSELQVDDPFSFHYDLHHINLARIMTAQVVQHQAGADPAECLRLLARLQAATDQMGWIHHKIQVLVLQALVLQASQDQQGALKTLGAALALAQPDGYIRTFTSEGANMQRLLSSLPAQGASRRYATSLLGAFQADPSRQGLTLIEPLSPREIEVLSMLTTSLSVTEIAEELVISVNTARSHIKSIYSKLGVNRRLDAIEMAKELHLDQE
jgi:LuxR family maltose regulon positive regulatory protein